MTEDDVALLTYARDAESGTLLFAIVADDEGADYVWPQNGQWFDGEQRIEMLVQNSGAPTTESEWLTLATLSLGQNVRVDEATPFDDIEAAIDEAEEALAEVDPEDGDDTPVLGSAKAAFEQIEQDYPDFMENEDDIDPQALDNYVMMMLGPIDPEGPNGWILRAVDGEPREGDENMFVHVPGTPLPDQEDTE